MLNLNRLGLSKGVTYEAIVTSYNLDGIPNAAPMDIMVADRKARGTLNQYILI